MIMALIIPVLFIAYTPPREVLSVLYLSALDLCLSEIEFRNASFNPFACSSVISDSCEEEDIIITTIAIMNGKINANNAYSIRTILFYTIIFNKT